MRLPKVLNQSQMQKFEKSIKRIEGPGKGSDANRLRLCGVVF